jgi:hypothetical protein
MKNKESEEEDEVHGRSVVLKAVGEGIATELSTRRPFVTPRCVPEYMRINK